MFSLFKTKKTTPKKLKQIKADDWLMKVTCKYGGTPIATFSSENDDSYSVTIKKNYGKISFPVEEIIENPYLCEQRLLEWMKKECPICRGD